MDYAVYTGCSNLNKSGDPSTSLIFALNHMHATKRDYLYAHRKCFEYDFCL